MVRFCLPFRVTPKKAAIFIPLRFIRSPPKRSPHISHSRSTQLVISRLIYVLPIHLTPRSQNQFTECISLINCGVVELRTPGELSVHFSTEGNVDFQSGPPPPKKKSLACMVTRNEYSLNIYPDKSEQGLYTVKQKAE